MRAKATYNRGACAKDGCGKPAEECVAWAHVDKDNSKSDIFHVCKEHMDIATQTWSYTMTPYNDAPKGVSGVTAVTPDGRTIGGAADGGKCPCARVGVYGPCSSEIVGTVRGGDRPTDPDYYNVCSNHAEHYTGDGWKTWQEYSKPTPTLDPSLKFEGWTEEEFEVICASCGSKFRDHTGTGFTANCPGGGGGKFVAPAPSASAPAPSPADVTYNGGKCPYKGSCNSTDIVAFAHTVASGKFNICSAHADEYKHFKTFGTYPLEEGDK